MPRIGLGSSACPTHWGDEERLAKGHGRRSHLDETGASRQPLEANQHFRGTSYFNALTEALVQALDCSSLKTWLVSPMLVHTGGICHVSLGDSEEWWCAGLTVAFTVGAQGPLPRALELPLPAAFTRGQVVLGGDLARREVSRLHESSR